MGLSSNHRGTTNRILHGLPQAAFDRLKPHLNATTLTYRQTIWRTGAPVVGVYFLNKGLISLIKTTTDSRTVEIGAVGSEGVAGGFGLLGIGRAIYDGVVQIPGTALCVDRNSLQKEMAESPALRNCIERYLQILISQLVQTVACNSFHSIESRCCRWLLTAHDSAGSESFRLTHDFLATMLGVQRSGVSITASSLQRAGVIRYTHGRVTVVDRAGLEAAACECYSAIGTQYEQVLGWPMRD
jgi:CRP-like cAMP-binding protein